ncbi:MAG: M67 family metallopeptidase [Deltaproteobacteria bacterium]|nr:M67 family metallopeptidase [Deltaproteobacteria bacterium]
MNVPSELALTEQAWDEISRHARETFPEECCGIILHNGKSYEVRRCTNIQNHLHALDPDTYRRTAATAYAMDPKELEAILQEAEPRGARIRAFYHSHPDHEAYFSAEDRAFATPFGEPTFPEAAQIVISIYERTVRRISAYVWSEEKKDFIEIPLRKS